MISLERLFVFQQWFIAFRKKQPFSLPLAMNDFQIIRPSAGRFFADPFVIEHEGKHFVFFEDFHLKNRKGVISCIEIDEHGKYSAPRVVLKKEHHLAYPFLFKTDQGIFMIPDTSVNNTVELYEAVNFPDQWRLKRVLMSGFKTADSTLFFYNKMWWLFTNLLDAKNPAYAGELHVFFAESLYSEWIPHPQNPVNRDPRTARPAGNLFFYDGKLIRPAQNCSGKYGLSVVFNEITSLTETHYEEKPISEIGPDWCEKNQKLHTYNYNDQWEVIDGLINVTDILKPLRWLSAYWHRRYG